jgi:hypothetical protein
LVLTALHAGAAHQLPVNPYLDFVRNDPEIPENCRKFALSIFEGVSRKIFYGIKGSKSRGFTHEYDITRDEASFLWSVFRKGREFDPRTIEMLDKNPRLRSAFGVLYQNGPAKGFQFHSEGEILELLALVDLEKEYPADKYFMMGGLVYHEHNSSTDLGELDIIVVRRQDCGVVAVGEAKLGKEAGSTARKQIQRFLEFLAVKLRKPALARINNCEAPLSN